MKTLLFLFLPIAGILGLIAHTEYHLKQGETFLVEITGYDPRDMLKGHYLNFQFKWRYDLEKTRRFAKVHPRQWSQEDYLCVIGKGNDYKTYPVKLESAGECQFVIKGQFYASGQHHNYDQKLVDEFGEDEFTFRTGVEEFYVPEEHAKTLEALLREKKSFMEIQLNHQNRPMLKELYIDNKPWRTWI